jgi:hypothetical protein
LPLPSLSFLPLLLGAQLPISLELLAVDLCQPLLISRQLLAADLRLPLLISFPLPAVALRLPLLPPSRRLLLDFRPADRRSTQIVWRRFSKNLVSDGPEQVVKEPLLGLARTFGFDAAG